MMFAMEGIEVGPNLNMAIKDFDMLKVFISFMHQLLMEFSKERYRILIMGLLN